MHEGQLLLLVVGSLAVTALCRRWEWPAPLVLVAAGLAVSAIPGFPEVELDSDVVLGVALPPLLYSAALRCSYTGFRASIGPITALGVGLVGITTLVVGIVASLIVPDMPLAVAFVLGAIVAPPDAVAATSIGKRLGLPRRVVMILTGESLINDATALTLYKVALAAALGAGSGLLAGIGVFVWTTLAGITVGLVLGGGVYWLRQRLDDPVLGTVFGLVLPFVAYLVGEALDASGVLAVVSAGLLLGHRSPRMGYATRLQEEPVWDALDTLLEAVVFGLIGIQLRFVVDRVIESQYALGRVTLGSLIILLVVIGVRFAAVFGFGGIVRRLQRRGRARSMPSPTARTMTVVSWAGMRGVVTLAVAAAIPQTLDNGAPFPDRAVIQLMAFVVTIGTLLIQGLTLPALIRRLQAQDPHERERDADAEARIYARSTEAALARLEELRATWPPEHHALLDRIATVVRSEARTALDAARAREEETAEEAAEEDGAARSTLPAAVHEVRAELLAVQRAVLLDERDGGDVDDEVIRDVLHRLDLEEAALDAGTTQGDV